MSKTVHVWSSEEKEYLKKITPGHHHTEIQALMSEKFSYEYSTEQIKGALTNHKLTTGFTGYFEKGHVSANKGVKGKHAKGSEKGWFKEGNKPTNYKPLGAEIVNAVGYAMVKTTEPNTWRLKHQLIWEEYNGPIPKGHSVIFGDGDRNNLDINNLILVSKNQLLTLNRNKLIKNDAELTIIGVAIADVYIKINEKKALNKEIKGR